MQFQTIIQTITHLTNKKKITSNHLQKKNRVKPKSKYQVGTQYLMTNLTIKTIENQPRVKVWTLQKTKRIRNQLKIKMIHLLLLFKRKVMLCQPIKMRLLVSLKEVIRYPTITLSIIQKKK
jgi:hypothetical protein